jgi:predicted O-methyltransferase YrrM
MDDNYIHTYPDALDAILAETVRLGFDMASEPKTGALLRTLAASKPNGNFLELGTGTGLSAAWILGGMDSNSKLTTVDNDCKPVEIAKKYLQNDSRVNFIIQDGEEFLKQDDGRYDFIFADAWPGKFSYLSECVALLKVGGIYIIDDLLPQKNWPEDHAPRIPELMKKIEAMPNIKTTRMAWASGIMIAVKS